MSLHESFHGSRIASAVIQADWLASELIALPGFVPGTDPVEKREIAHLEDQFQILFQEESHSLELVLTGEIELGKGHMGDPELRRVEPEQVAAETSNGLPQLPVQIRKRLTPDDGCVDHRQGAGEEPHSDAPKFQGWCPETEIIQNFLDSGMIYAFASEKGDVRKGDFPHPPDAQTGFQQIPPVPNLTSGGFVQQEGKGGH
jgi:hypothetical protein